MECFVEGEHFFEQQRQRPPVEQQVMMAPNKLMRIFRESDEREAQQRSLSEIESLFVISFQELLQSRLLFRRRDSAPIKLVPRQLDFRMHDLERLLQVLPNQRRPCEWSGIQNFLPNSLECFGVELALKCAGKLDE